MRWARCPAHVPPRFAPQFEAKTDTSSGRLILHPSSGFRFGVVFHIRPTVKVLVALTSGSSDILPPILVVSFYFLDHLIGDEPAAPEAEPRNSLGTLITRRRHSLTSDKSIILLCLGQVVDERSILVNVALDVETEKRPLGPLFSCSLPPGICHMAGMLPEVSNTI